MRPTQLNELMPRHFKYGSDLVVDLLKRLGIEYVAFNPGSSFRGIHDSLVNYDAGNPEVLLCCHEEICVSIAHGYAIASGKPMAPVLDLGRRFNFPNTHPLDLTGAEESLIPHALSGKSSSMRTGCWAPGRCAGGRGGSGHGIDTTGGQAKAVGRGWAMNSGRLSG